MESRHKKPLNPSIRIYGAGSKALVAQNFEFDQNSKIPLPKPLNHFLQLISGSSSNKKKGDVNLLCKKIIHGHIDSDDEMIPTFSYTPEQTGKPIPLHAASSMISELAPFMLLEAGTMRPFNYVIFEEPEAHLHLEAQREIARVIAKLVSQGTYVVLTTHSDTFVQQINNLTRIYNHPNKEALMAALGYDKNDLIDPKNINAYEFCLENEFSNVKKLDVSNYGIAVSSLNETLIKLAEETASLSED